nr:lysine-rich arabinogalactan protein 19-like [Penaeus vannamei]
MSQPKTSDYHRQANTIISHQKRQPPYHNPQNVQPLNPRSPTVSEHHHSPRSVSPQPHASAPQSAPHNQPPYVSHRQPQASAPISPHPAPSAPERQDQSQPTVSPQKRQPLWPARHLIAPNRRIGIWDHASDLKSSVV